MPAGRVGCRHGLRHLTGHGKEDVHRVPAPSSALTCPCPHNPHLPPVALTGWFWPQGAAVEKVASRAFSSKAFNSPFFPLFPVAPHRLYQQEHHTTV